MLDDDAIVLDLVVLTLRTQGYTVLMAGSAAEATRVTQQHADRIDLVLSDVHMPGISGPEAVRALLPFWRDTVPKVLFMSGQVDEAMAVPEIRHPGVAFLPKPFGTRALLKKVEEVLRTPD